MTTLTRATQRSLTRDLAGSSENAWLRNLGVAEEAGGGLPDITGWVFDAAYAASASAPNNGFPGAMTGLVYNNDGSKIYFGHDVGFGDSYLMHTSPDLSAAFVPEAGSTITNLFTQSGGTRIRDMGFSSDGTRVYFISFGNSTLNEYDNNGTAFNPVSGDLSLSDTLTGVTSPICMAVRRNGTQIFWVVNGAGGAVRSVTMSTPDDLTTGAIDAETFDPSNESSNGFTGMAVSDDGLSMYLMSNTEEAIFEYEFAVAGDLSTLSYTGRSKDITADKVAGDETIFGLDVSPDNKHMILFSRDSTSGQGGAVLHYTV